MHFLSVVINNLAISSSTLYMTGKVLMDMIFLWYVLKAFPLITKSRKMSNRRKSINEL